MTRKKAQADVVLVAKHTKSEVRLLPDFYFCGLSRWPCEVTCDIEPLTSVLSGMYESQEGQRADTKA